MRYYRIVLTNPDTGKVFQPVGAIDSASSWTSFLNGKTVAGAQNIELDIPVFDFATPAGAAFVRVWGVSLQDIAQANNLAGFNISVYGGMQKGLPLANPQQNGLLISGLVYQAFGNWVGTDMTLDMVIQPATGSPDDPASLAIKWLKGSSLSDDITSALGQAFPDYTPNVNINSSLILSEDTAFNYQTLSQFASYVQQLSQGIVQAKDYPGVRIVLKDKTFNVYDGSSQTDPIQAQFQDMIGQPTWIEPLQLQAKFVMRADLSVGAYLQFPATQVSTSSAGAVPFGAGISQQSSFKGSFLIQSVRHAGNFRQDEGDEAWSTTVNCISIQTTDLTATDTLSEFVSASLGG